MKIVLIKFLSKLHLGEILCENKIMTYKGNKYKILIYKLFGTYYCCMKNLNEDEFFIHSFSENINGKSKTLPVDEVVFRMIKSYDRDSKYYMYD